MSATTTSFVKPLEVDKAPEKSQEILKEITANVKAETVEKVKAFLNENHLSLLQQLSPSPLPTLRTGSITVWESSFHREL